MKYLKEYFYILNERLSKLIFMVLLILLSSILDLLSIGAIIPFVGSVFLPNEKDGEWWRFVLEEVSNIVGIENTPLVLGLLVLLIFYIKGLTTYFLRKQIIVFSMHHLARLRNRLMSVYQNAPYSFLLSRNSAELIQSINGHTTNYVSGTLNSSLQLFAEGLTFIVILLFLASVSLKAVLFASILLGSVLILFYVFFRKRILIAGRNTNLANQELIRSVKEGVRGFKEIRVLGVNEFFYDFFSNNTKRYSESTSKYQGYILIPRYLIEASIVTFIICLSVFAQKNNLNSISLVPIIGVFGLAAMRLMPAAISIMHSINHLKFSRHSMLCVHQDLIDANEIEKEIIKSNVRSSVSKRSNLFSSFKLDNVYYHYPSSKKDIIKDATFSIESGQSIGIVGNSGAGKTTFINLILGILKPHKGKIELNGSNLDLNSRDWLDLVAYIPQTIFMSDSSLRNNIALGIREEDIDEKSLNDAILKSQLIDVIKGLPNGLNTIIGEDGIRLSGGQCQRVAIARALYHKREVIIMDEATSALDSETENAIIDEVANLKGTVTFIIIAHSDAILKQCDFIYKISNGEIKQVFKNQF